MKKKILLVDDVRLFLKLEETFFKRTGCEIFTAQSGEEAIDLAQKLKPELILLDFIMPDMMGDAVVAKLKADPATRSIPIIIVSTSSDAKDIEKCFAAGADDYVTKPINPQEVLSKAANLLNIPQRFHYRLPVTIKVQGESGVSSFIGFSRNLSLGGILVECRETVPMQAGVELELPIFPDGRNLNLKGRVVRMDEGQTRQVTLLGIHFEEIGDRDRQMIDQFIHQYESP
jgi:CheY-like chemotaxis protein